MTKHNYNLAIETSGITGSLTLGCQDEVVVTRQLERRNRNTIKLMPTLDSICKQHNIKPLDIKEIYVSVGPGSFTGLRVAIATVKMLALVNPALKIIGVPSLDVIAQNTPLEFNNSAVCLNLKRQTVHSAIFSRSASRAMEKTSEAKLRTLDELLKIAPQPLALIGNPLPEQADELKEYSITCFTDKTALANSAALWKIGQQRAKADKFDSLDKLNPLYIREPEAVTLWNKRKGATN